MARIFITGSADGLGFLAGQLLAEQGHEVVLHARSELRAKDVKARLPRCEHVVIGDVSTIKIMKNVAQQVNELGRFDAIIHNVGVGINEPRIETEDGLTHLFAVNVAAPYVLTALIQRPQRLTYLSSGMHHGGEASFNDVQWKKRSWDASQAYSDSKLFDTTLAVGLARRWPGVFVNAVNPGWVPTRMGGAGAPDNLIEGAGTQAWLAVSDEPAALVSGYYFHHKKPRPMNPLAQKSEVQEQLFSYLQKVTNVTLPL